MKLPERIYRSRCGIFLSKVARIVLTAHRPIMIYGFPDPATKKFRKYTRISSSAIIMSKNRLAIEDHVWVWHHSILDATEGLKIEEGVQIGAWVVFLPMVVKAP